MHSSVMAIIGHGDSLFTKRSPMLGLWQTIADNFYPERADFTFARNVGAEFASDLYSSYPIMARRDLGNSLSSMLRRDKWFKIRTDLQDESVSALKWLDTATDVQFKLMNARSSGFMRATKEGDHDFAAFGQTVISIELNKNKNGLLYRCWHLRDVVWSEDYAGNVDTIHRKWKPRAVDLKNMFKNVSSKVVDICKKKPNAEINCRHIVVPSEHYEAEDFSRFPYVSLFVDVDHDHVMEAIGINHKIYVIPRWQTVSGSQYAYSPCTVAALPDGRLIQAMTQTLLEAGEKFTNPPMIGVKEALRSDVQVYAGGMTWVNEQYDERLGEVLRPLTQDRGGMPIGFEMQDDVRNQIAEAFFLNKLTLPSAKDMTAYETSERIKEFVRQTLPLFEPMEIEYNGQLCEDTFELLSANGAFGSPADVPEEIAGRDTIFQFSSPIKTAVDRDKGQTFLEMKNLLREAMEVDQGATANLDINEAFRDALEGVGVPAKWMNEDDVVEQKREEQAMQQAAMMAMEQAG